MYSYTIAGGTFLGEVKPSRSLVENEIIDKINQLSQNVTFLLEKLVREVSFVGQKRSCAGGCLGFRAEFMQISLTYMNIDFFSVIRNRTVLCSLQKYVMAKHQ